MKIFIKYLNKLEEEKNKGTISLEIYEKLKEKEKINSKNIIEILKISKPKNIRKKVKSNKNPPIN